MLGHESGGRGRRDASPLFYIFALTDKRAATGAADDLNGCRCLPRQPAGVALLSDLVAASPGGLVNRPHLITYCVSFAPHVWAQTEARTENSRLWSWCWLNTVEPESLCCASDRLRSSRRRRHVMRARGFTTLYLYRVQDCLPCFFSVF